ncbi:RTA1-domain protein [Rhizoctonia solani AG-3 Rhs1AP]|uniref:RTA1-domain protein n=1 Tax=Rhizoctonia solani AG-3 Rhs1AP TaxID=1086054 RepID=X8IVK1_9AGAM|nr:RTA1-domain protein [Rhizoctonia solani AG-3 Rhs1AP]
MSTSHSLSILLLFLLPAAQAANSANPLDIDPFTDAKHDTANPLRYIPSNGLALAACAAYVLVVLMSIGWSVKRPARYMLTLMISGALYALGLYFRTVFAKDPHSIPKFIVMHMLVVLSPCGLIATVYMLLGRLALALSADDLLLIRASRITKVYIISDVVTLIIQSGGGSMGISSSESMRNLGSKLFLIGMILQCISFISYLIVFGVFIQRVRTWRGPQWESRHKDPLRHWTALALSIVISCVGISIRTIYRTLEAGEGMHGPLATIESYFYILDCLPLWISTVVFVLTWPPMYLDVPKFVGSESVLELNPSPYSKV